MKKVIADIIRKSNRIVISSHIRPDADSIGSGLALYFMLEQLGKDVYFYNADPAPFPINQLPGYEKIQLRQIHPEPFDIIILVECGTEERSGQTQIDKYKTICIDHHPTSYNDADINWINQNAAAVGEMIFELGEELNINFNKTIAFNLYSAIVSDTGSFKYSNTTFTSLQIASALLKTELFRPNEVSNLLFNSNQYDKVVMIEKVLATLTMKLEGRVAIINFQKHFLENLSLKDIETEDIISIARSIIGVQATLFYKEIDDDYFRVSIRSKGDVSAQKVSLAFNGGGHHHAAGFFFKGSLDQAINDTLDVLKKQIK